MDDTTSFIVPVVLTIFCILGATAFFVKWFFSGGAAELGSTSDRQSESTKKSKSSKAGQQKQKQPKQQPTGNASAENSASKSKASSKKSKKKQAASSTDVPRESRRETPKIQKQTKSRAVEDATEEEPIHAVAGDHDEPDARDEPVLVATPTKVSVPSSPTTNGHMSFEGGASPEKVDDSMVDDHLSRDERESLNYTLVGHPPESIRKKAKTTRKRPRRI